ncbi:hypothetical protein [Yersinia mollaretii]|uniref:hypothetical protein n=1 Tax=Yersinia mollaretii TaxID=33060 RepID=UPI001643AFEC|nr:hypothetical protein [Yersinia mollaretii]
MIRVSECSQQRHSFKDNKYSPKSLELWLGGKRTHPDELTQVSDSGKRVQPTTPQLQGRRGIKKASELTHWLVKNTITQKF